MIEVNTKYTYEGYKQYYWFSLFRGKYYRYSKVIFHIFTVLAVVIAILAFTWLHSVPAAAISTVGTVAFFWLYLMSIIRPKRYVKQSPALFQSGYTFIFDEDSFSTMTTGDITSGTSTAQYSALIKVYETIEVFYVYITPVQAYLLPKKDIVKGTPEELRGLLQSKLPQGKYILCK